MRRNFPGLLIYPPPTLPPTPAQASPPRAEPVCVTRAARLGQPAVIGSWPTVAKLRCQQWLALPNCDRYPAAMSVAKEGRQQNVFSVTGVKRRFMDHELLGGYLRVFFFDHGSAPVLCDLSRMIAPCRWEELSECPRGDAGRMSGDKRGEMLGPVDRASGGIRRERRGPVIGRLGVLIGECGGFGIKIWPVEF